MRLWTVSISSFGSASRTAKVSSGSPSLGCHRSQRPAKAQGSPLRSAKAKGCLVFPSVPLPFVKGVGGDQAAALLQRFAIGRLGGRFLRAGVDGAVAELGLLGPEGHQAPAQLRELAIARVTIQPHNRLHALWRGVVAGGEPRHPFQLHAEPVGENFLVYFRRIGRT